MSADPWDCAHAQAQQALFLSNPNPRVGCVLVAPDGREIGEGHTQAAGGPHAEVMALRDAQARGESVVGASAYVTLEPCSHFGRTPPCCDALIEAQLGRVHVALTDPNPRVAGQGLARLRAAGIEVALLPEDHPAAVRSRELNIGFISRMVRGRPWVRMKIAASLDGFTALPDGQSQWITGEAARAHGHRWRARSCAVLTGIGTVRADDPRLDARIEGLSRQPHVVVVDSRLETPPDARLFDEPAAGGTRHIWVYHAIEDGPSANALRARGAYTVRLADAHGKVDLRAMLNDLALREVNELHVEAGFKLNSSLWRAGVVDELLLYTAPRLLGGGAGLLAIPPLAELEHSPVLHIQELGMVGADVSVRAVTGLSVNFFRSSFG